MTSQEDSDTCMSTSPSQFELVLHESWEASRIPQEHQASRQGPVFIANIERSELFPVVDRLSSFTVSSKIDALRGNVLYSFRLPLPPDSQPSGIETCPTCKGLGRIIRE